MKKASFVFKSLDREKREKLALIEELGQKDQKINQLEKLVKELSRVGKY